MPTLDRYSAIFFGNQLKSARLAALADSEAFDEIIHAIERLGSFLAKERLADKGNFGTLGAYKDELEELATKTTLGNPAYEASWLTLPFPGLYKTVRNARNDALHQGAFARHLTKHAIELSIILEEALATYRNMVVADFMVTGPVCAELWQPLGFIRQQMLANSYSYLPVYANDQTWHLISDSSIAQFLGPDRGGGERTKRMARTVEAASSEFATLLTPAKTLGPDSSIESALDLLKDNYALLIIRSREERTQGPGDLLGIVTAFDLL